MTKFFLTCLLLVSFSGTLVANEPPLLPGENILGQTYTDCDSGKANNEPRKEGKADLSDTFDSDDGSGENTQDI